MWSSIHTFCLLLISFCHTHTQRQPITSTLTTHTPLSVCLSLSLSPSLSVCLLPLRSSLLTAALSLHPSAKRSGSKNLPSSSSSLPLCVFSFLLLGHTSSASQRSTGKALSVSLNSCNKQMHTRTADSLDLNLEKFQWHFLKKHPY